MLDTVPLIVSSPVERHRSVFLVYSLKFNRVTPAMHCLTVRLCPAALGIATVFAVAASTAGAWHGMLRCSVRSSKCKSPWQWPLRPGSVA